MASPALQCLPSSLLKSRLMIFSQNIILSSDLVKATSCGVRIWSKPHPVFAAFGQKICCVCRVFEPRYRRLLKCCQESNGCFALANYGVGISVMLDRLQVEEDSSNSISIRGGRRFVVQEGSAKVMPGSFGLTVVEPNYIYVRPARTFQTTLSRRNSAPAHNGTCIVICLFAPA